MIEPVTWTPENTVFSRQHGKWDLVWWIGIPSAISIRRESNTGKLYIIRGYSNKRDECTLLAGPCESQEEVNACLAFLNMHGLLDGEEIVT